MRITAHLTAIPVTFDRAPEWSRKRASRGFAVVFFRQLTLPPTARKFVTAFDAGEPVEPFKFTVTFEPWHIAKEWEFRHA